MTDDDGDGGIIDRLRRVRETFIWDDDGAAELPDDLNYRTINGDLKVDPYGPSLRSESDIKDAVVEAVRRRTASDVRIPSGQSVTRTVDPAVDPTETAEELREETDRLTRPEHTYTVRCTRCETLHPADLRADPKVPPKNSTRVDCPTAYGGCGWEDQVHEVIGPGWEPAKWLLECPWCEERTLRWDWPGPRDGAMVDEDDHLCPDCERRRETGRERRPDSPLTLPTHAENDDGHDVLAVTITVTYPVLEVVGKTLVSGHSDIPED